MKEISKLLNRYINTITTPLMADITVTSNNERINVTISEPDGVDELILIYLEIVKFANDRNLLIQSMDGTDPVTVILKEKEVTT